MMTMESLLYYATWLAGFLILKWVWNTLNAVWFVPKKLEKRLRQQGLGGNSYRFPAGDMKEISKARKESMQKPISFTHDYFPRIQPVLHQLITKYGPNCVTWMGTAPTINVTDPELIREVFSRHEEFRKPRTNPLTMVLSPGITGYEGEKWQKHRRLVNPAFQMERLKLMLPAFRASISDIMEQWEKKVPEVSSCEMDVWPYFTNLTADVISRAAFGSSYEEGRQVFELLTEQKDLVMTHLPYAYIPGYKYFPTKGNKRMQETDTEIRALLSMIIGKRKRAMEAGEATKNDLLGILLESNFRESQNELSENKKGKLAINFHELIDECKLFFLAGQETTSVLLAWTMILLSKHQDWQTKAREEVVATFGTNPPDYDGLSRLKMMQMILHEVLRLYPGVVATSRRVFDCDTKLGDLVVPPGAVINLSILHAHHDPEAWGNDAKEFKPERFSEGIAKATNGKTSYFPFGWGARICIGQNFALTEAKMAISMILQQFAFELSPSYAHAPISLLALQPQFGAHLILRRV